MKKASKDPLASGSLLDVWKITYPLLISLLSTALLTFADRYMLSQYSLDAMNACATSGMFFFACLLWLLTTAGTSEVFVGQFKGSGQLASMPKATWQVIWLCLLSILYFIPISLWGPDLLFSGSPTKALETSYFRWLAVPAFMQGIFSGLVGYFIGQKKVYLVTFITLGGNVLNIVFNGIFIFGWQDIPVMGIDGAALGTDLAVFLQTVVLFYFFIRDQRKNRYPFKENIPWDTAFIKKYLRVCLPTAVAHTTEMIAHCLVFKVMTLSGFLYITTLSIAQTIYFFIGFTTEALSKSVATISANAIGSKEFSVLNKTLVSAIKLLGLVGFVCLTMLFVWGEDAIAIFLKGEQGQTLSSVLYDEIMDNSFYSLFFLIIYLVLDGFVWALSGTLSACGKTKSIFFAQASCVWIIYALPNIYLVYFLKAEPFWVFANSCLYALAVMTCLLWAYKKMPWSEVTMV